MVKKWRSEAGRDYSARSQWLRAAVLGANDGLVSVASLMIGVGARENDFEEKEKKLPSPAQAAGASALAFALGALLPLLAGGFIKPWGARLGTVCGVSSLGLAGFGAVGAVLGGANVAKSATRVLVGGWVAMLVTYVRGAVRGVRGGKGVMQEMEELLPKSKMMPADVEGRL
ncbi:hypothetical protein QJS10_CPB15g00832 [Acorus calamus]|uniref:Vacuolar iron transporter n=1 Tax=Acorus calamus TaxID=4465 RepID=A0AAV9D4W8_ACOCL|nr:hypothetical protein QJS10_CPB15g00832 [Acorus calamus]